ncbi:MAG: hypothetical protein R6V12_15160 [Candidatus Hydrogenedentota bacterium]
MNKALVKVFRDVIRDKSLLSLRDKRKLLNILLEEVFNMDIEYLERIKDKNSFSYLKKINEEYEKVINGKEPYQKNHFDSDYKAYTKAYFEIGKIMDKWEEEVKE